MRRVLATILLTLTLGTPLTAFADGGSPTNSLPNLLPPPEATMPLEDDLGQNYKRELLEPPAKTPKVKLLSSWPKENVALLAEPREARLTFDKKVRPVDVTLEIKRIDIEDKWQSAVRTETDPGLKTVRFSLPNMTVAAYKLRWKAGESSGEYNFRVKEPILAPGGGNHRHDSGLLNGFPWFERIAIAITLLLISGLFFRYKFRVITQSILIALLTITAGVRSYQLVNGASVLDNGDKSWINGLSSTGVWSWVIILITTILVVTGKNITLIQKIVAGGLVGYLQATALNAHTVAPKMILGTTYGALLAISILSIVVSMEKNKYGQRALYYTYTLLGVTVFITLWSRTNFGVITNDFKDALLIRTAEYIALILVSFLPFIMKKLGEKRRTKALLTNAIEKESAVNMPDNWSNSESGLEKKDNRVVTLLQAESTSGEPTLFKEIISIIKRARIYVFKNISTRVYDEKTILALQILMIILISTPSPLAAGLGGDRL